MNPKKIIAILLALLLACAALSACGNKGGTNTPTETEPDALVDTSLVKEPDEVALAWESYTDDLNGAALATDSELTYRVENGKAELLSYTGSASAVRIPDTLGGAPVTKIADGAFAENKTLTVLTLPDGVLEIGEGILRGCTALSALQTPLLGKHADGAQYLGYLFGSDSYLNNPRDVPATLKCLVLSGESASLPAYALFDCNDLVCVGLSEGTLTVEKFALYNCASLTYVHGLERVLRIGDRALMDCSSLERVSLSRDLAEIGFGAFEGCDALCWLEIPFVGASRTENTYLAYIFGAEYHDFAAGYYPRALAHVKVLEGCTALNDYAFFECLNLKEIVLPQTLESIGVRAFYGCEKLWSVAIPDAVHTVREAAFFGCDGLLSVDFGAGLTTLGINAFYNCDSLDQIALPNALRALPASCFAGCISLRTVELGGVTEVGAQAFRGCDAIETVKASGKVTFGDGNDRVKNILELE